MINQFKRLKDSHFQVEPFYLTNCWDVASAKLIEKQGAVVIGTSSYAVAQSLGYNDGEEVPFSYVVWLAERLVGNTTLPVTLDAEGLYSSGLKELGHHAEHLIRTGISGLNFEDQLLRDGSGRWPIQEQVKRIRLIKEVASQLEVEIFLNARTDVFFQGTNHQGLVEEVIERGRAYAEAGADGFFIPGTTDVAIVERVVNEVPLPINIMAEGKSSREKWHQIGVKRISTGPHTYLDHQNQLAKKLSEVMSND
ncbi:isocitrate lyase/phosphoenolpyruvate mutase family protein [uncultured Vagococcus sp.]|uniref:isocitrate lyase/PEP mutase family protein n=1 Tax=uncultured Vagococcus sp. TaxID=189676 RepID=UPI0028D5F992|nr:isocitrate lyase/phosphoenolpyruvate mutase family protein [uncultured Vagococcus sp.]